MINSDLDVAEAKIAYGSAGVTIMLNNEYCESRGWGNAYSGSQIFGCVEITITAKKNIPAKTVIATSSKKLLTYVQRQGDQTLAIVDKNIRTDVAIASGTSIDIYIPTRIIE